METNVAYDPLGRLEHARRNDGAAAVFDWAYSYDALGNVQELRDLIGTAGAALSYGGSDSVCRIGYGPGGLGGTACNVKHDDAGNIVEQLTRTGGRKLSYFASGKVRRIAEGAAQATFRYDAFGNVHELDITGAGVSDTRDERRYGPLITGRVGGPNGAATLISRNIPAPGGVVASRRGTSNDWVFEFRDLRGNRFFTNSSGEFIQDVDYEPYGEAKSSGKQPGSPEYTSLQWNQQDALAAFDISHLGERLYDPVIGRFLSRDPSLVPRTANTTNPYAFSSDDPWNAADPSGLDDCGGNFGQECQYLASLKSGRLCDFAFQFAHWQLYPYTAGTRREFRTGDHRGNSVQDESLRNTWICAERI